MGESSGLDDPQRSLPTPNMRWFCVILCRQYAIHHRKTLLNEGITESYQRGHLSPLERLSCKTRLKAGVQLTQQDEEWEATCMLFMDPWGRERSIKVTLAEGWINSMWELGVCSFPALEQPCSSNAKTWLVLKSNLIKLEGSYLMWLMDIDDFLYPSVQSTEELIWACKITWFSQNDFE